MHQIFFSVSTKRKKIILKNNFSLDSLMFKTQFLPSFSQRDLSQVDVLRQIKEKYLISEIKLFVVRTGILVYFYTDDIIYIFQSVSSIYSNLLQNILGYRYKQNQRDTSVIL